MTKVVLDSQLREKLNGLGEQIEVCDETGKSVGYFIPWQRYEELFYAALEAETPLSREELKRRHQEQGGRPLAEFRSKLGL